MSYYPIKCVHCMRTMKNEEVLFDIMSAVVDVDDTLRKEAGRRGASQGFQANNGMYDKEDDADNSDGDFISDTNDKKPKAPESIEGMYTAAGIQKMFPEGFERVEVTVRMPESETQNPNQYSGNLLQSVRFMKDESMRIAHVRHCCHCGKTLPRQAGVMPTYVILLIGTSNAGKTVYLTSLYHSLRECQIPFGSIYMNAQGQIGRRFQQLSTDMFKHGRLPPATIVTLEEPLVMHITINVNNNIKEISNKKECLLCLMDMRGEDWTRDIDLAQRAMHFRRLDGFVMILDPFAFSESHRVFVNHQDSIRPEVMDEFITQMQTTVLPLFNNNEVTSPTAVVITKCDMFYHNSNRLTAVGLGLDVPGIAPKMPRTLDSEYFGLLEQGTRRILKTMSPNVMGCIESGFTNTGFTTLSAIGYEGGISELNTMENPDLIQPRRVMEPILWILMKLDVLPPYYLMLNNKDPKVMAHNYYNLNEWGKWFCPDWKTLS